MDKSLFKELYHFELDRRAKLLESMNSLITGLALLGGFLGYLAESHDTSHHVLLIFFVLFFILALISYGITIYNMINYFLINVEYQVIPTPSDLKLYYEKLVAFYKENNDAEGDPDYAFENYLNNRYAEATDFNADANYIRGDCQRKAFKALIFTVIFTFVSALPNFILKAVTINPEPINSVSQEINK